MLLYSQILSTKIFYLYLGKVGIAETTHKKEELQNE
jgi:hypothetical protein